MKITKKLKLIEFSNFIITCTAALYISIVFYLSTFNTIRYFLVFPLIYVVFLWLLLAIKKELFSGVNRKSKVDKDESSLPVLFAITFFIVFCGNLLYWLAYFPGGFNLDAYGQWDQVHGLQQWNNWHPVFTTACYWIVTRIYDNFAFTIFVQILSFSFSIAFLLMTVYRTYKHKRLIILTAIYIALNPAICMNNICLIKDVPFTIAVIWATIILVRIIETKGSWLNSIVHVSLLVLDMISITLIRHNGIFYTIPLILCVACLYRKQLKQLILVGVFCIVGLAIIQGPVFSHFDIQEHSNVTGEIIGVPMSIMANSFVEEPDKTPEEVKDFLLSIADRDDWTEKYILGEWDSCKWDFGGVELLNDESPLNILKLTVSTIKATPDEAYKSFRENTRVVWQVFGTVEWDTWVYVEENIYGICEMPNKFLNDAMTTVVNITKTPVVSSFCWNIGVPVLIFIIGIWWLFHCKTYYMTALIIPILSYNFFTMLLLCGPSHRYFYLNSVLFLPILLVLLNSDHEENNAKTNHLVYID